MKDQTEQLPALVKNNIALADPYKYQTAIQESLKSLLARAEAAAGEIEDQETYEAAVSIGVEIHGRQKKIEAEIEEAFLSPARKIKQSADRLLKSVIEPMEFSKAALRRALTVYREEQARLARIEQEKILAAERKRQEELDRAARAAFEKKRKEEEDARLAAAEEAEKSGDRLRAEAILNAPQNVVAPDPLPPPPVMTPPAAVNPEIERSAGEVRRVKWRGAIVDRNAFLNALASGKIPWEAIKVNESWLNSLAKTFGDRLGNYVPGARAEAVADTSFRE